MSDKVYAKGVGWDLSDLYKSDDDPQIEKDVKKAKKQLKKFNQQYKNKINEKDITGQILYSAFKYLEKLYEINTKLYVYFYLRFQKDTKNQDVSAKFSKMEDLWSQLDSKVIWFELDLNKLSDSKIKELLKDKKIIEYRKYIKSIREFKPYQLSEKEEKVDIRLRQTGILAFRKYYSKFHSSQEYIIEIDGREERLPYAQMMTYLSDHSDRKIRKRAALAMSKAFEKNSMTYTFVLNNRLLNRKIEDDLRGYEFPAKKTFLDYEVKKETVNALKEAVQKGYKISKKFYKAKAELLGYEKLYEWDRYSRVFEKNDKEYSWQEAKDIIKRSFSQFSQKFENTAQKFFDREWVDAEITDSKANGASCYYLTPDLHPYIFLNYDGKVSDVTTLAHEAGHGIHAYLASKQNLLQFMPTTVVAEIASVFCESLVFENLYKEIKDRKQKINLMAKKIQISFSTVFRQMAFYIFSEDIYTHYKEKGELTTKEINTYFQKRLQEMFGDGLELTEKHKSWWSSVSHFFQFDFYVFTYSFGELLTLSLYSKYKEENKSFAKNYIGALEAGGSKDPYELTEMMGLDINKADFWSKGLDLLDGYVDEFIDLAHGVTV